MQQSRPTKPSRVFDRGSEWDALTAFVGRPLPHAALGVLSGRRRMGKTYLLRALVEQCGGFYFGATDATEAESLRQFSAALAEYMGSPVAFSFATWDDAVSYLFSLGAPGARTSGGPTPDAPFLVVVDEFPYLVRAAPELPSLIQRAIDRGQVEESRMRLLLCGSAMSVMGGLLASSAPLRGRAQLELVVRPFGYRAAADFWGVATDPGLAARLHAVLGGTPAYRRQFLADDVPADLNGFDDWTAARSFLRSALCSERPGTCSPRRPTSGTLRSTTPCWPPWHRATPPAEASRDTSAASPSTSHTHSMSWRTATSWCGRPMSSGPENPSTASPSP